MDPYENKAWRLVGKVRASLSDLDTKAAIMFGRDFDPNGAGERVDSLAWMVQADYVYKPWLQFFVRYDEARVDSATQERTITPSVHTFLRMNIVLRLETTIGLKAESAMPEAQLELFYAF